MVGGAHHGLVVLHHQHRVPQVPQALEGADEAGVVHGVEANGRLVADVEDAHEGGADLGGQADALGLAAGEAARGAVQGEVVQAHVHQEGEARADLLQDLGGNGPLPLVQGGVRAA